MSDSIRTLLFQWGIELCAPIPLSVCHITNERKLARCNFGENAELFAYMMAIPYMTPQDSRNISAYAVSRDYHGFYSALFSDVLPRLRQLHPEYGFFGFADSSPIDEREAAARAGLGIIGDNGLIITEKYSSYIFLGEIITDMPLDCKVYEIEHCHSCGACRRACPMDEIGTCLSALTQKKGELTDSECDTVIKYGSAWGCDICQEVCPHTKAAIKSGSIYTNLGYFKEKTIPRLTLSILDGMSDEEFATRAFSWRGRQTIRRNLELFEKTDENT